MRRALMIATTLVACGGDDNADGTDTTITSATQTSPTSGSSTTTAGAETTSDLPTDETTDAPPTTTTTDPSSSSSTTAATGCGACNEPNQQCIDDSCITGCQGQSPDPCGPAQVCDVMSGECIDPEAACVAGTSQPCGAGLCGPGTVCDGQGSCLAVAPCALATCTSDGRCWGGACQCERGVTCSDPSADLLNGPFSADISALDFADDCTAWAVTVSGSKEYVRRLTPAGELVSFGADGDYDLGEVRVLRRLTVPQLTAKPDNVLSTNDATHVEGYGEVALTYICCPCPECGSCVGNPSARGVARLVDDNPAMPLPIVIFAEATQGTGPFGEVHLDSGPQGLTWGDDRVLYVGNTSGDGQFESADLAAGTTAPLYLFNDRVTASAAVSPVHLLVAIHAGPLYRLNTATLEAEFVVDLMSGVTSLSHDAFTGDVYASLSSLEVVRVRPFTGEVEAFATMPARGRVAVSPSGNLWYTPVKYLGQAALSSWPLPASL